MKVKYLLPCSCGREIPVEASQAGQEIRCECGATLEVPPMRGLAQLDRAGSEPAARQAPGASEATQTRDKPAAGRSTLTWGARQRLLLIGAVVAALGLGLATFLYVLRPRLPDTESLSPIGTWQLWYDLRQGIEQRPPWEEQYLNAVAAHFRWSVMAWTIAGIGMLVMASSLLIRTRRPRRRVSRPAPRAGARSP